MTLAAGALKEAQGFGAQVVYKTVAFDGTAGGGASGTAVPVFTVTGGVVVMVVGVCTESLTVSDGALVECGVVGVTGGLIASTTASLITVGTIWRDASPAVLETMASFGGAYIAGGLDIVLTVGVANITDGTIVFSCFWNPLTADANVIAS